MESLSYDVLKVAYHLGLAVIVAGGLVLGTAAAPAIFQTARTRGDAGTIFGNVLARYDGLAILSVIAVALASLVKAFAFETVAPELVVRWIALGVMSASVLYASAWSNPVARAIRAQAKVWDELPESSPLRREFDALHRRSRRAMSLAVLVGVVALYLS